MQRALAAVFLVALLAGQVGMLGALIGRHHVRQQMHRTLAAAPESLDGRTVQHLTIPRSERQSPRSSFVRIDEQEFRYRGNLYDVVRAEWRGDVWHAWVVHDREEEQYLDALARSVSGPMLEREAVPSHWRPLLHRPLALVPAAWAAAPSPRSSVRSFAPFSSSVPEAPYLTVPHPPPWA
ncbi:MAG: hypothetical protein ABEL97_13350 [Salinibacter sp.]